LVPSILERKARAGYKVSHGAGDEHLTRVGEPHHPRRDVHGDPADVIAPPDLDLARMNSNPHVEAERPHSLDNSLPTANGSRWTIEGRQEAVSHRLDLTSAKTRHFAPDQRIVPVQQGSPGQIPKAARPPSRVYDVCEENGREHPIWFDLRP
jgi:hypothetical protein